MKRIIEEEYQLPARWVEERADDTLQNAEFSAPLLHADGVKSIWLVTHAAHATRAKQAFEAHGFSLFATHFKPPHRLGVNDFIPTCGGLALSRSLLYEWINRLRH